MTGAYRVSRHDLRAVGTRTSRDTRAPPRLVQPRAIHWFIVRCVCGGGGGGNGQRAADGGQKAVDSGQWRGAVGMG